MTIIATEGMQEGGYYMAFAENDETGKKAIAESHKQGEALYYVSIKVKETNKGKKL